MFATVVVGYCEWDKLVGVVDLNTDLLKMDEIVGAGMIEQVEEDIDGNVMTEACLVGNSLGSAVEDSHLKILMIAVVEMVEVAVQMVEVVENAAVVDVMVGDEDDAIEVEIGTEIAFFHVRHDRLV
jgi:hypothetical protein